MKYQWFIILHLLVSSASAQESVSGDDKDALPRPDLVGRVVDEVGNAIANAMVFIHSAGPKSGSSTFCPTCYPDCRKRVKSGEDGAFLIPRLDPKLKFKVLAVAKGFEPTFLKEVDPAKRQSNIVLTPRDPELMNETNRIAGQVFAPSGKPLAGAVLSVGYVEKRNGTQHGGVGRFVDETIVADEKGLFVAAVHSSEVLKVGAKLEGPGTAPRWVTMKPGSDHVIQSGEGVSVTGRLRHEGAGIPGVIIGMSSRDRSAGVGFYDLNSVTDAEGRFRLDNIPTQHAFSLYAKMKELSGRGSVNPRPVNTGKEGTSVDVGDISLGAAHTFRGQIVMPKGVKIPEETRLHLGRDDAWDSQQTLVEDDGYFEFRGVPEESVSLSFRIPGYRLSKKNPSLDWLNGMILGRMDRDLTDFNILMEKGEWDHNVARDEAPPGVEVYPKDAPLRSAP